MSADLLLDLAESAKPTKKVWGWEYELTNGLYCAKLLRIEGGYRCSLHYHKQKDETFIILDGVVYLEQQDVRGNPFAEYLLCGDKRHIPPNTPHRFSSRAEAWILEVSTHHDDDDVVRIVDSGPVP